MLKRHVTTAWIVVSVSTLVFLASLAIWSELRTARPSAHQLYLSETYKDNSIRTSTQLIALINSTDAHTQRIDDPNRWEPSYLLLRRSYPLPPSTPNLPPIPDPAIEFPPNGQPPHQRLFVLFDIDLGLNTSAEASLLYRASPLHPDTPRGVWPANSRWVRTEVYKVSFLSLLIAWSLLMLASLLFPSVRSQAFPWIAHPAHTLRSLINTRKRQPPRGFQVLSNPPPNQSTPINPDQRPET